MRAYGRVRVGRCGVKNSDHLGFFGGSLCPSSGHSLSTTARISSEMAETFSVSSMSFGGSALNRATSRRVGPLVTSARPSSMEGCQVSTAMRRQVCSDAH
jgi:hypothetical protein